MPRVCWVCIGAYFSYTYIPPYSCPHDSCTRRHRCGSVVLSGCTCIWADLSWQTIKRVFSLGTVSQNLWWRWVFVRHFTVNCYSRPYIHSVRKAISPYLPLQARGWHHDVVDVFTTELYCQTLLVCVRHIHVTKISIWRVYTKFKWRQFEYHSAIQSLKHLIWESWMMHYRHIYTAFCIIIKLKVMFWKLYTRIYFNVGTFNPRIADVISNS